MQEWRAVQSPLCTSVYCGPFDQLCRQKSSGRHQLHGHCMNSPAGFARDCTAVCAAPDGLDFGRGRGDSAASGFAVLRGGPGVRDPVHLAVRAPPAALPRHPAGHLLVSPACCLSPILIVRSCQSLTPFQICAHPYRFLLAAWSVSAF